MELAFWQQLAIICPLVFLAGFVDAAAGGGGIISIPAYLLAGLPPHLAAGTNKMSACLATVAASANFFKSGKIQWRVSLWAAGGALLGSALGTRLALHLSARLLEQLLLAALPVVAVFLLFSSRIKSKKERPPLSAVQMALRSLAIGLCVGCYDGLIGPGTGTFLILAFNLVLGMDLLLACGCAKISNLASNLASVALYAASGKIVFLLALPASACGMLGGWCGAQFAIRGGSKKIRYVMFLVLGLLFIKTALDL